MIKITRAGNVTLMGLLLIATLYTNAARSQTDQQLPPNSLYHLQVALENQMGQTRGLDQNRGQPVLVTMFYASCPHVCPLLISTIKVTEARLTESERAKLRVLTISIDPERDTPTVLLDTMNRHAVDSDRWSMVRPEPGDVRAIAGVLGIKYKRLPGGEFNHSTKIVLLDGDGRPIAGTAQLGRHDPAFLEAIKASLK